MLEHRRRINSPAQGTKIHTLQISFAHLAGCEQPYEILSLCFMNIENRICFSLYHSVYNRPLYVWSSQYVQSQMCMNQIHILQLWLIWAEARIIWGSCIGKLDNTCSHKMLTACIRKLADCASWSQGWTADTVITENGSCRQAKVWVFPPWPPLFLSMDCSSHEKGHATSLFPEIMTFPHNIVTRVILKDLRLVNLWSGHLLLHIRWPRSTFTRQITVVTCEVSKRRLESHSRINTSQGNKIILGSPRYAFGVMK